MKEGISLLQLTRTLAKTNCGVTNIVFGAQCFQSFSVGRLLFVDRRNFWCAYFAFVTDSDLARKVLLVGKSINFIRYSCEDTQWVLETSNKLRTLYPEAASIADGSPLSSTLPEVQETEDAFSVKEKLSTTTGLDMLNKIRPLVHEAQRLSNFRVMDLVLNEHR